MNNARAALCFVLCSVWLSWKKVRDLQHQQQSPKPGHQTMASAEPTLSSVLEDNFPYQLHDAEAWAKLFAAGVASTSHQARYRYLHALRMAIMIQTKAVRSVPNRRVST